MQPASHTSKPVRLGVVAYIYEYGGAWPSSLTKRNRRRIGNSKSIHGAHLTHTTFSLTGHFLVRNTWLWYVVSPYRIKALLQVVSDIKAVIAAFVVEDAFVAPNLFRCLLGLCGESFQIPKTSSRMGFTAGTPVPIDTRHRRLPRNWLSPHTSCACFQSGLFCS